ncbi:MAG: MATE family efflux transporter [Peptostreptococcaceae bacterium]|nr:MATE family efflux transporter [Peptostreptococcaceae bacterium]
MIKLALPIAAQSLISSTLNLVDNLMVGSIGEAELAAVGIATQLFFVHWMLMFGFTSGSATFMAQFWGAKNLTNIRKTTGFAISVCGSISLIFFIFAFFAPRTVLSVFTDIPLIIDLGEGYVQVVALTLLLISITVPFTAALRATHQTHIPLIISLFVFSTNTFLNYVLIFGKFGAPEMGVTGAGVATLIARTLEFILVMFMVFGRKNIISGKLKEFFSWTKEFTKRVLNNAIPTTVNETMWGLGTAMYVAAYARMGITEFAAVQASNTINHVFIMVAFSMGDAALILVGQKIGEGQLDYSYFLAKRLLKIGTLIGVGLGLLLIILSKPLISLFGFTPEGEKYAFIILIIYGIVMGLQLYTGMNIVGILRAGGDTKFAMFTECGSIWLIGVPIAFFGALVFQFPIYIVVALVKLEEVVKFFILRKRFKSGKWINNVINKL